ncbi:transposase family protein [Streptomyces sp. NPDC020681]|uniref:transposase family protein n=1 Tax=Streptomyces sp. NPDC020681 TaxID=3365083 RepID=UPI0037911F3F
MEETSPGVARSESSQFVKTEYPRLRGQGSRGSRRNLRTPFKRHCGRLLTAHQRVVNRAHARLRDSVERSFVRLKDWRIFRHAACGPNCPTSSIVQGVVTPVRRR